jgi:hypothetical protein
MTAELFFIIGYVLFILVLWVIPFFRKILIEHKPELLGLSSVYIFLLADIKSSNTSLVIAGKNWDDLNSTLVVIGIILGIIGIILSSYNKSKLQTLANLTEELQETKMKLNDIQDEYFKLCSDNIKDFFKPFFSSANGNGRVSLYKHDENYFKLLGRAADNPEHRKRGLEKYPDSEGFIAKGWQNGTFEIHSIPIWKGNGSKYRSFIKINCNISDSRLNILTMKSRSFYVYRFNNHDSAKPHGIIVFEKLNETQIQTDIINGIFQTHSTQIISLLKSMKSLK